MYVCVYTYIIYYIYFYFSWLSPISLPHEMYISGAERSLPVWSHPLFLSAVLFHANVDISSLLIPRLFYPRTLAHIWIAYPSLPRLLLVSFLPKSPVTLKMRVSLTSVSQTALLSLTPSNTVLSFLHLAPDICSIYYLFIVRPEYQLCEDKSSPISPAPCVAYSIDHNTMNRRENKGGIRSKLPWQQVSVDKCARAGRP